MTLGAALLVTSLAAAAQAQGAPAGRDAAGTPAAGRDTAALPGDQRIERLVTEDAGSRIDELRVGGQLRRVTVQPKGDVPAWQVLTEDAASAGATGASGADGSGGRRVWPLLSF